MNLRNKAHVVSTSSLPRRVFQAIDLLWFYTILLLFSLIGDAWERRHGRGYEGRNNAVRFQWRRRVDMGQWQSPERSRRFLIEWTLNQFCNWIALLHSQHRKTKTNSWTECGLAFMICFCRVHWRWDEQIYAVRKCMQQLQIIVW